MEFFHVIGVATILTVFPEEIWELFLDRLEDTESTVHFAEAFPETGTIFRTKQFSWFIGRIMPLLLPKHISKFQNIMNLRLVSRKWKDSVDTCLHKHPDRRPYGFSADVVISESHFNYWRLPNITTEIFPRSWEVDSFFEFFRQNSTQNPFPGRCIHMNMDSADSSANHVQDIHQRHIKVLKLVGHHVWYVTFTLPNVRHILYRVDPKEIIQQLFEHLTHLTNLKSLRIDEGLRPYFSQYPSLLEPYPDFIPSGLSSINLPHLETIEVYVDVDDKPNHVSVIFYQALMTSIVLKQDNLKKLAAHSRHWKKSSAAAFSNVTELILQEYSRDALGSMLNDTTFSCLRKLGIRTSSDTYIGNILGAIQPLQIESLNLEGCLNANAFHQRRPWNLSSMRKSLTFLRPSQISKSRKNGAVVSVQSLHMSVPPGLYLSFLDRLPSLESISIQIHSCRRWTRPDHAVNRKFKDPRSKSLHSLLYTCNHSAENFYPIRSWLPNLNIITICVNIQPSLPQRVFQYIRECRERSFHTVLQSRPPDFKYF